MEPNESSLQVEIVSPDPQLMESMRSVGYTIEAAVADVIDNSITAEATNIDLRYSSNGPFEIAIVDDGYGMNREGAIDAMRLAARSPMDNRKEGDLGRFGLGLKTASLSQCRRLTLVTKQGENVYAYCWNLDHVIQTHSWALIKLEPGEYESLLGWEVLEKYEHGTLINWRDIDQVSVTEGSSQDDFNLALMRVSEHLSLVFHRFLAGTDVEKRFIRVNGKAIKPLDPFLEGHKSTQVSPVETIDVEGEEVKACAYTLPYITKLSNADKEQIKVLGVLRDSQGFYIYRAHRLVIWGTWFRVTTRTEHAKLTRVKVDIPNSLDHLWSLDIKKSAAEPPAIVRKRLKELAQRMTTPSTKVQRFRGRKLKSADPITRMWNHIEDRDHFRYEINRQHPDIARLEESLDPEGIQIFGDLLGLIEATFPVVDAHNRLSQDAVPIQENLDSEALLQRAIAGWEHLKSMFTVEQYASQIAKTEPYNLVDNIESSLVKALS